MVIKIGATGVLIGLLCAFWSGSAFADPQTPNQTNPQSPKEQQAVYCESFLPAGDAPTIRQTTWLSAHILPGGEIRDAAVVQSSGRSDLDDAAVACANHSHSLPALIDGAPAEIVWSMMVEWRPANHVYAMLGKTPGQRTFFCMNHYPDTARQNHESGGALVTFLIEPDGSVRQPEIAKSSGFKDLDDAAAACVLGWRYAPATFNGKPVEFGWSAQVNWLWAP